MNKASNHGGSRVGAGRPRGSVNRRSLLLADELLSMGKCPAKALVRIAENAEANGDHSLALDAWKAVLPYVHAKPKAVEADPEGLVALSEELAEVRRNAMAPEPNADYGHLLREALKKAGVPDA